MSFNQKDCERALALMPPHEQAIFLCHLGHKLTVAGRFAYEFQAPGVTNPRLLRDLNEIHHRIYPQIRGLLQLGTGPFDAESLSAWLAGEDRSQELQSACLSAFEQCLSYSVGRTQQGIQLDGPASGGSAS